VDLTGSAVAKPSVKRLRVDASKSNPESWNGIARWLARAGDDPRFEAARASTMLLWKSRGVMAQAKRPRRSCRSPLLGVRARRRASWCRPRGPSGPGGLGTARSSR
jgi:hypothetical protein